MKRRRFFKAMAATPLAPALIAQQLAVPNNTQAPTSPAPPPLDATQSPAPLDRTPMAAPGKLETAVADEVAEMAPRYFTRAQFSALRKLSDPDARNGQATRDLVGGAGCIWRFRNIKTKEKNFIRGYAFDLSTGGTSNARYFPSWGEELQKDLESARGAGFGATPMGEVLPRFENHVRIETLGEICRAAKIEVLHLTDRMFPPGYSIHELGTCRMADNPKTSVLNKWNQSHDIRNPYVVDGSSFVTGEHLADQLKKREI
jgi:choline dehydrogenase-like flavoprotein